MRSFFTGLAVSLALSPVAALADADWPVPAEAKTTVNPVAADDAARAAGQKVYETRCMTCHGPTGLGDGKASGYLKVKPTDLTTKSAQSETDGELFWRISTGRKPMPAFADKLTETERWQVVHFMRTLAAKPAKSETELPASPAVPAAKTDTK